jgi:hypothetical protein
MFDRILNAFHDIINTSGTYNAHRRNLVDTGIGSVQLRHQFVAVDLTVDQAAQVGLYALPVNFHIELISHLVTCTLI